MTHPNKPKQIRQDERPALRAAAGDKCARCGAEASYTEKGRITLELHHIIRPEDGGSNEPENLQLLCKGCHIATHVELRKVAKEVSPRKVPRLEPDDLPYLHMVTEAAERLGLKRRQVIRMCNQGVFPGAFLWTRDWFIPIAAVESEIARRQAEPEKKRGRPPRKPPTT